MIPRFYDGENIEKRADFHQFILGYRGGGLIGGFVTQRFFFKN
jgi:hypothetical protein